MDDTKICHGVVGVSETDGPTPPTKRIGKQNGMGDVSNSLNSEGPEVADTPTSRFFNCLDVPAEQQRSDRWLPLCPGVPAKHSSKQNLVLHLTEVS